MEGENRIYRLGNSSMHAAIVEASVRQNAVQLSAMLSCIPTRCRQHHNQAAQKQALHSLIPLQALQSTSDVIFAATVSKFSSTLFCEVCTYTSIRSGELSTRAHPCARPCASQPPVSASQLEQQCAR